MHGQVSWTPWGACASVGLLVRHKVPAVEDGMGEASSGVTL